MVDIQLDTPLVLGLTAAAVALYIFSVRESTDLLDQGGAAAASATGTFYNDFIEPISPSNIGQQGNRIISWIGRRF